MLSTIELMNLLRNAIIYKDSQELINMYAEELVNRIYIQNDKISREDMLKEFGYKNINKTLKKEINESRAIHN